MSTSKSKDEAQSDTKDDDRRKLIDDLEAKIKNLQSMSDDVEYDLLKLHHELYNISQKRAENLKARIKKMIKEGDVEPLQTGHCHPTNANQNPNPNQGQSQGASSWPAVPEDFDDDEWYVLDQCNLPRNTKLMSHVTEHFAHFLCFPGDKAGR
ncbi:unnamed protein product [Fusarium langsethiae]|nr:unnamed protein product [Fusarium langsethiae]GKU17167.1 unnamed protein product [Fusarium langsethiae]